MQLKSFTIVILLSLFIFLLDAYADDSVKIKYQHYEDDKSIYYKDTDGVVSNRLLLSLKKFIRENTSISLDMDVDSVSSASARIDAVTSASQKAGEEDRIDGKAGITHTSGTSIYSAGVGMSRENNYNSDLVYASIGKEFNKRNTNVTFLISETRDEIESVRIGDGRDFPKSKDTSTIGLSLSQTLTPRTVAAIGYEFSSVDGYQAHPENIVNLSDTSEYTNEVHPESRERNATVIRINQYLTWKAALHADYRYYNDSWGVKSDTYGLKYYHYITEDLILRARYRYYSQGKADFYSASSESGTPYPTIDGKLRSFDSTLYGIKIIKDITGLVSGLGLAKVENASFNLKYDRYGQSGGDDNYGINADIVQAGVDLGF